MLNYLNQKRIRTKNKTSGRKKKNFHPKNLGEDETPRKTKRLDWLSTTGSSCSHPPFRISAHAMDSQRLPPSWPPGVSDVESSSTTKWGFWKKKRRIGNVMFRNWVKSPKHCNFVWRKRWIQRSFIDSVMLVFPMLQCLGSPGPPAEKNHTKRCNHSQKTFFEHASWSRLLLGFKEVCGTCIYTNHPPNVLTIIIHQNGTRKSVVMMIFHQPGRPSVQE